MIDRRYRVRVKGGGSFLYDTIDVGRFALMMAEEGDPRPFTVKPWPWWSRIASRVQTWRETYV